MFFSFRAEGVFSFVPKLRFSLSVVGQTYARQTEAVPSSSFYNYVANCNLATHAAVFVLFPKYGVVPFGCLGQISGVKLRNGKVDVLRLICVLGINGGITYRLFHTFSYLIHKKLRTSL